MQKISITCTITLKKTSRLKSLIPLTQQHDGLFYAAQKLWSALYPLHKKLLPMSAVVLMYGKCPPGIRWSRISLLKRFPVTECSQRRFFKLRYTYQVLRQALYSGRYNDVISWYNQYMVFDQNSSVVKNLCNCFKAGALYRSSGQNKEAALSLQ